MRGKVSLLYDFQRAADVDAETLYNIALAGAACRRAAHSALLNCIIYRLRAATRCRARSGRSWRPPACLPSFPAGFDKLCRVDARIRAYGDVLLSRSALSINRDQMTAEENAKLDGTLREILGLLTNHFLTPAALQILELFIRKYK